MKRAYADRGRQYGFGFGSGAGPGFLQLAAKRVAEGGRFGTIIGVALGTGSKAYGRARRNLSRHFDIDTVIISRDPRRINFSDSANLNELMVVGTRNDTPFVEKKDAPAPAREAASRKAAFVVLTRNPATPAKAKQLARLISNIDRSAPRGVIQGFGEYVMDEVRDAASWDILNFSNPDLSMFLRKASTGKTPAGAQPPGRSPTPGRRRAGDGMEFHKIPNPSGSAFSSSFSSISRAAPATRADGGPRRKKSSTSATADSLPSIKTVTLPSLSFFAQPRTPARNAASRVAARKPTP